MNTFLFSSFVLAFWSLLLWCLYVFVQIRLLISWFSLCMKSILNTGESEFVFNILPLTQLHFSWFYQMTDSKFSHVCLSESTLTVCSVCSQTGFPLCVMSPWISLSDSLLIIISVMRRGGFTVPPAPEEQWTSIISFCRGKVRVRAVYADGFMFCLAFLLLMSLQRDREVKVNFKNKSTLTLMMLLAHVLPLKENK